MNKVIFITGASSGFGAAIAREFAHHGYNLILLSRREKRLFALKRELERNNTDIKVHTVKADIQDKNAVFDCVASLPDAFQHIDILVNNAGLALGQDTFSQADLDDFEVMVNTNIKGFYMLQRLFYRLWEKEAISST